jgi:hydroxypyruvate isomerase
MTLLSVKINNLFGEEVAYGDMVHRAAAAGADAIGFRPWYDAHLDEVVEAAADAGVDIAYLSGGSPDTEGPEFPLTDPGARDQAVEDIRYAIDVASDVGGAFVNVIPGQRREKLDPAVEHVSIVTALRQVAGHAERAGVTLLVEPINTVVDHPGIYLTSSYEGYKIINAVDSPNVRLLYDVYHQQITEGNLIANVRSHIDLIGHVHIGDVPGRHEPGTGEINYPSVLSALDDTGYEGYIGCEFEPTGDPEAAIRDVRSMLNEMG